MTDEAVAARAADAGIVRLGGGTSERELEITRASRVGSYGVVALVLVSLGRVAAVARIASDGTGTVARAFVGAHALARCSSVVLLCALPYVRRAGAAEPFACRVSVRRMAAAAVCASFIALGVGMLRGDAAVLAVDAVIDERRSCPAPFGAPDLVGDDEHRGVNGRFLGPELSPLWLDR